jgi:hypothetical protein
MEKLLYSILLFIDQLSAGRLLDAVINNTMDPIKIVKALPWTGKKTQNPKSC